MQNGATAGAQGTGSTDYACSICSRTFKRKRSVKIHMNIHSSEKPHKCNIEGCNKAYRWPSSLRYHVQTHLRQPPAQGENGISTVPDTDFQRRFRKNKRELEGILKEPHAGSAGGPRRTREPGSCLSTAMTADEWDAWLASMSALNYHPS
jgi:hypothetical protein